MHVSSMNCLQLQRGGPSACPKCDNVTFLTLVHVSLISGFGTHFGGNQSAPVRTLTWCTLISASSE